MADTAAPTEQSLDQQLEALFQGSDAPASGPGKDTKTEPGTKPGPAASPDPAPKEGTETPATEEDPLEKALKEITEEEEKPEEKVPQLSDEQQSVLKAIPNAETATQLFKVVNNYQNFVQTFESGDFKAVDAMFKNWNPEAYDDFLEHIYQEKMVSGDWAERFIAEAEGRSTEHKGLKSLEQKIAKLQSQLEAKGQGEAQAQQKVESLRVAKAYESYVDGLFDKIEFSKADRHWVMGDLNSRVGNDPKVMQAVRNGNMSALNGLFKAAVREYVNRDKQVTAETDKKVEQQSQKKPLAGGGLGAQTEGELPDDVRQVARGQEDNWMEQQLGKLARKVGLKK